MRFALLTAANDILNDTINGSYYVDGYTPNGSNSVYSGAYNYGYTTTYSYIRQDLDWLWWLVGAILLISILSLAYLHFHHRHMIDTYQAARNADNCRTGPANTVVYHPGYAYGNRNHYAYGYGGTYQTPQGSVLYGRPASYADYYETPGYGAHYAPGYYPGYPGPYAPAGYAADTRAYGDRAYVGGDNSMQTLRNRLANGEISKSEYERMRAILNPNTRL